ncbi:hypothetical protein HAZT_HAZT006109 [Hyalella azteca]|uniref:Aminopeptidase n=1 Tax=Hyalella azteca TaxID=294128 RepID=A0A6A0H111_HYAAZ|nr:hypothetical protein HAZT_HAZT006109 [Hyalella azteca]
MTVTTQLWLFTVCSTVSSSSSTVQLITEKLWDSHHSVESKRLPDLLEPMHYTLALKVYHWGNRTFSGRVSIAVRAKEDSSVVFLHCSKLNIFWDSVQVIDSSGTRQHRVVDHKILPGPEMIALVVRPRLIKDVAYNISIEFSGVMAEDEYGLYSLSYSNNGDTHYMALTQLQTTYGRQVFPCLDEPALKARFSLRVARPTNCTALSNTRRISTTLIEPGWVWDEFETTPLISTYILAFAVIDFDYLTVTGPGITFSGDERMVQRTPSSRTQDRVVTTKIVAHELAHMWLGNLVTPAWWDHIWLSEGFATFFAAQATSLIIPDGYVEGSFVAHEHWLSLATDVAPMSRAIYVPVLSNQTLLVFDDHTYNKGACLVRMMQFFMGEMNFRRSVSTYIKTRQFSTSTNWDLLSVLGDTNTVRERLPESVELSEVMRGWLTIVGYPLITITRLSNGTARLEQRLFTYSTSADIPADSFFWVPLSWISETDALSSEPPYRNLWLPPNNSTLQIQDIPNEQYWIIANVQRAGYYRVNYDTNNWLQLARQLQQNHLILTPSHRAQILDDAFHLYCANLLEEDILEALYAYVARELHAVVWKVLYANAHLPYREGIHPKNFMQLRDKLSRLLDV